MQISLHLIKGLVNILIIQPLIMESNIHSIMLIKNPTKRKDLE